VYVQMILWPMYELYSPHHVLVMIVLIDFFCKKKHGMVGPLASCDDLILR
jgi:hypothetical protein